ncbi:hypothetical protein [Runella zeae]|uniref:hypothetical protein n=1 Tax=Runella zeae TaxID=94255 RepID=UPI0003F79BC0|nr:hypothetical protein [Runella zeae]
MEDIEIIIKDETMTGVVQNQFKLTVSSNKVKIKDLIKSRVFQEVEIYNQNKSVFFQELTKSRKTSFGANTLKEPESVDAEEQYYFTLESFQKNRFFLLVDNQQYSDLEEEITIYQNISVSFIRLIALVGG